MSGKVIIKYQGGRIPETSAWNILEVFQGKGYTPSEIKYGGIREGRTITYDFNGGRVPTLDELKKMFPESKLEFEVKNNGK